jgi:hypothetical protein
MLEHIDPQNRIGARWPTDPFVLNRPDRMDVIRDKLADLIPVESRLERVMGLNMLNFFKRNLPD